MTAENEDVAAGRPVKTVSLGNLSCGRGKPGHPTTRKTPTVQHTNRQSRTRQARTIARSGPSLRRCDYRAARPPSLVYGRPIPFMDALSKLLFGLHFPLWTPYHFLLWTQRWPTCASLGRRRELGARRRPEKLPRGAAFEHEPEKAAAPHGGGVATKFAYFGVKSTKVRRGADAWAPNLLKSVAWRQLC